MQRTCSLLQAVAPGPCGLRQEIFREDLVLLHSFLQIPLCFTPTSVLFNMGPIYDMNGLISIKICDLSGPRYELNVNDWAGREGTRALEHLKGKKKVETEVSTAVKVCKNG
jgi:hypothetical protein